MMKALLQHIEYHTADMATATAFYKDLAAFLGWSILFDGGEEILGISAEGVEFWVSATPAENRGAGFSRDASGLNHLGLKVETKEAVDQFQREFMQPRGIEPQFGTPRWREDFGPTYYQVMFVDPTGLAIEVYTS